MSYIKKIIRNIVIFFYKIIFHLLKTKKNIILFESSNGRNYTGNPKYIYEYLINSPMCDKFKYVWSVEDTSLDIPGHPIKVRRTRLKYLYYSIVSNFWIFDSRHPKYLLKKNDCIYIQTWHGTPLKKLALDMNQLNMSGKTDINQYKAEFKENTSFWNYLIAQNDFSADIFSRAFDFKGTMLKIGYPRNDILIKEKNNAELKSIIKEKLKIAKNKKIILYAPTWRDNEFHSEGLYKFTSKMDFDLMKEKLANDYTLIIKYHYLVRENIDWNKYSDFIVITDEKQEIQDLYLISDILITDYSSVMFDYSLLNKPMIFYTYDLDYYKKNLRGFYFNIEEEVPGPIIEKNEDLITYLENFSFDDYFLEFEDKYSKFREKYNQYDKGDSSKKVAKLIMSNN